jgi:hypothetical protein
MQPESVLFSVHQMFCSFTRGFMPGFVDLQTIDAVIAISNNMASSLISKPV